MKIIAKLLPVFLVLLPVAASAASGHDDTAAQVKVEVGGGGSASSGSGSAGAGVQTSATVQVKSDDNIGSQSQEGPSDNMRSSDKSGAEMENTSGDDNGTDANLEVHGDPDFDLFVKSAKEDDGDVESADVDSDGAVEVEYKHQGHLFGFIPVTLNSHTAVSADADGNAVVKVNMPWWSFLVSDASDIRSAIEASLSGDAELNANAKAGEHVKLAEIVLSALAKVKAGYNVKANVK